MEKQLTKEEITRVFALYAGASIAYPKDDYSAGWSVGNFNWSVVADTYYSVTNTKLSLKPLSAITDEDAIKVGEVFYGNSNIEKNNFTKIDLLNQGRFLTQNHDCIEQLNYDTRSFLLSRGYSVPLWFGIDHWANSKNAIELGIAIDNTKQ